jgi:hypothetical protein
MEYVGWSISRPSSCKEQKALVALCAIAQGGILFLASFIPSVSACVDKWDKKVCARLFIHKAIYFYFAEKSFFPKRMQRRFTSLLAAYYKNFRLAEMLKRR